ncbi:MAG: tRNA epoxyqueuosine(34) reductase QueG [Proteobacteria bacterium]|nr:tRNA epoxyqueuosine(34) reductase QueG [Pseudomonadota bacterium]
MEKPADFCHHIPMTEPNVMALLAKRAKEYGFAVLGVAGTGEDQTQTDRLDAFLAAGYHGDMAWLEHTRDRRIAPKAMWDQAKSAIVLGMNYAPDHDPMDNLKARSHGNISVYARGRDYHDIIKGKLKQLAATLSREAGVEVKVFVDTAPLMEKPLAAKAGLGWQGKHTNLVSREFGSWLFIGVILTTLELPLSDSSADHCGSCQKCLDICPTKAFPKPYQLDARRCISYLTIEYDGLIPLPMRQPMGNRIFGCDDCLAVCPWNRFAKEANEAKLAAREALSLPELDRLLRLDDRSFREMFTASPVKRTGYHRFMRNVLIAAGNSRDASFIETIMPHLDAEDSVIRGTTIWALSQLLNRDDFLTLAEKGKKQEKDQAVLLEWDTGISICIAPAKIK